MKKNYFLTVLTFCFCAISFGQVVLSESFSYADGALVGNGDWANGSGTDGTFLVSSGKAVVDHSQSEDVVLSFTSISGNVYVGFDFSVDDLGASYSGTDNEYFAHMSFRAQMDIVPATNGGDYSVGISSDPNTAEAVWATDLTFGQQYRAIIKFNQDTGTAELWIDATASSDTSILGSDDGAYNVSQFGLRQSTSSENEIIRVDDLMIGQTFEDVVTFVQQATCGADLGDATYTCDAMTFGTDGVTVNIPYTGSDATITSVTSDMGTVGGDNPAMTADGTITISGLSEGDSWTLTLNGGTVCDGDMTSGTVEATQCYPTCFDLSTGSELFESVVVTANTQEDAWSVNNGSYSMNGYIASDTYEDIDTWLVFGPLDMTGVNDLELVFDSSESFGDTDLVVAYTTSYGACPSASTWTTASTITDAGTQTIDMSNVAGTEVFIGIQYADFDDNGYSSWTISNVKLGASTCPVLGTRPTSDCDATASVSENQIEGFAAYPNPTTNNLTIASSNTAAKEITIFNVIGKKVLAKEVSGAKNTINVSSLNSGIYILKVSQDDKIATQKLVIE